MRATSGSVYRRCGCRNHAFALASWPPHRLRRGAGAAGTRIARLAETVVREQDPGANLRRAIVMVDSRGLVFDGRDHLDDNQSDHPRPPTRSCAGKIPLTRDAAERAVARLEAGGSASGAVRAYAWDRTGTAPSARAGAAGPMTTRSPVQYLPVLFLGAFQGLLGGPLILGQYRPDAQHFVRRAKVRLTMRDPYLRSGSASPSAASFLQTLRTDSSCALVRTSQSGSAS